MDKFMDWMQSGGLIAIGVIVYAALSLAGQVTQLVDGPDDDPDDRPSKAKAVIEKLMAMLRTFGIGARYKNEGPSNPLPLSGDTKTRIATIKEPPPK